MKTVRKVTKPARAGKARGPRRARELQPVSRNTYLTRDMVAGGGRNRISTK